MWYKFAEELLDPKKKFVWFCLFVWVLGWFFVLVLLLFWFWVFCVLVRWLVGCLLGLWFGVWLFFWGFFAKTCLVLFVFFITEKLLAIFSRKWDKAFMNWHLKNLEICLFYIPSSLEISFWNTVKSKENLFFDCAVKDETTNFSHQKN